MRAAIKQLQAVGAVLVDVTVPMIEQVIPVLFGVLMPEASVYHRQMLRETPDLYGADVRLLFELGELITGTDYLHAQRVRTHIQRATAQMYQQIDVLITPTLPIAAARANEEAKTWPDGMVEPLLSAYTRYTCFGNVTGLPTLSVPCGFTDGGLPIGMQISGRPLDEKTVLRTGRAYEQATSWGDRCPSLLR